jgi:hypothetical protein
MGEPFEFREFAQARHNRVFVTGCASRILSGVLTPRLPP